MDIKEKLDLLSDMQSQADVIRMHFDDLRKMILTPEIQQQLADIDAEMVTSIESLQTGIDQLTSEIKSDVVTGCTTVKGNYLMAVWNKGRESWDGKLLSGYAVAHPEILTARKIGEPSVTIRKV